MITLDPNLTVRSIEAVNLEEVFGHAAELKVEQRVSATCWPKNDITKFKLNPRRAFT